MSSWAQFKLDIESTNRLTYIGASVSEGYNATDTFKYSHRMILQNSLNAYYGVKNVGYMRLSSPQINVRYPITSGWSKILDFSAYSGGYVQSNVAWQTDTLVADYKKVRLVYEAGGGDVTFYGLKGELGTVDTSVGTGVTKSQWFDATDELAQTIKVANRSTTLTKVYGIDFMGDNSSVAMDAYVKSGVSAEAVTDTNLSLYTNNGTNPVIFALGYNDTDYNALRQKAEYVINECAANNMSVLLFDIDFFNNKPSYGSLMQDLADENSNVFIMKQSDILTAGDMDDTIHPTNSGHYKDAEYICSNLGIPMVAPAEVETATEISICGDQSLYGGTQIVKTSSGNSLLSGGVTPWVDGSIQKLTCRFKNFPVPYTAILKTEGYQRYGDLQVFTDSTDFKCRFFIWDVGALLSPVLLTEDKPHTFCIRRDGGYVILEIDGYNVSRDAASFNSPSGGSKFIIGEADMEVYEFSSVGLGEFTYNLNVSEYLSSTITDSSGNGVDGDLNTGTWSHAYVERQAATPDVIKGLITAPLEAPQKVIYTDGDPFWDTDAVEWNPLNQDPTYSFTVITYDPFGLINYKLTMALELSLS